MVWPLHIGSHRIQSNMIVTILESIFSIVPCTVNLSFIFFF